MGIKNFVNKRVTKQVEFMGDKLEIRKMSLSEVEQIQELSKTIDAKTESGSRQILRVVLNFGVEGAADLSDEEFAGFPIDDLNNLSVEIMNFSGLGKLKADPATAS